jgi:hypothetical protein
MNAWIGEPEPIPRDILPERLSEDAYIALKKLECDHFLARVGLQGTLWGAVATLITLMVIVFIPVFSSKSIVDHWEVVGMAAVFVIPITLYGSFVFDRALKMSARIDKEGLSGQAQSEGGRSMGGKAGASEKPGTSSESAGSTAPN